MEFKIVSKKDNLLSKLFHLPLVLVVVLVIIGFFISIAGKFTIIT